MPIWRKICAVTIPELEGAFRLKMSQDNDNLWMIAHAEAGQPGSRRHWLISENRRSKEQIRNFIAETSSEIVQTTGQVIVLGAGNCLDIPLPHLLNTFSQVMLIDLDDEALQRGHDALDDSWWPGAIRGKIDDISGGAFRLQFECANALYESTLSAEECIDALTEAYQCLPSRLNSLGISSQSADFAISSMVANNFVQEPYNFFLYGLLELRNLPKTNSNFEKMERLYKAMKEAEHAAINHHIRELVRIVGSSGVAVLVLPEEGDIPFPIHMGKSIRDVKRLIEHQSKRVEQETSVNQLAERVGAIEGVRVLRAHQWGRIIDLPASKEWDQATMKMFQAVVIQAD